MSTSGFIKRVRDIMRQDEGVDGDAQRISQLTWLLFLKVYDAKEQEWELMDDKYKSIIPDKFKWRNWADDKKLTGDALLALLEDPKKGLFYTLKNLDIGPNTPIKQKIVKGVFEDANNYMKDGVLLRQVIDVINEIDFSVYKERHEFGLIYETILKELQAAGAAGEYYTPRAVTDFMVQMINPKLGESVADFACGTGGFLTSTLKYLEPSKKTAKDIEKYNNTIFGIEKKPMPYLLCITNMLLHDVDEPKIVHGNSLEKKVQEYTDKDKFDVILMNPPYGGTEKENVKNNFPADLRSSETADLFMSVIMYRLKKNGRCAVIIPDGFLFGQDNAKINIKKRLLESFNLHTVVRMPKSVFAPYTSITTNILFFDSKDKTKETWFYRMDLPEGYKAFSKTKPIELKHFDKVIEWWKNRKEIKDGDFFKARKYSKSELENLNYNLDLCGFPHEEEIILEPNELISKFKKERAEYSKQLDDILDKIMEIVNDKN